MPPAELYDHLLVVCLLLLLQERSAALADLREGLRPLGFEQTTAELRTTLAALGCDGLVEPSHDRARDGSGAYALTLDGVRWLREAKSELRRTEVVLGGFLARCSERFVMGA